MDFAISVLYFVTYYLTPATVFGPLATYRIELIFAALVTIISIPRWLDQSSQRRRNPWHC